MEQAQEDRTKWEVWTGLMSARLHSIQGGAGTPQFLSSSDFLTAALSARLCGLCLIHNKTQAHLSYQEVNIQPFLGITRATKGSFSSV